MIPTLFRILASSGAAIDCPSSSGSTGPAGCSTGLPKVSATSGQLHEVLAIVFGVAGVISVLMIIIGAIMFVTSGGNSDNATKARETIIYAVVGLVVSLSAEAIVAFALGNLHP